MKNSKIFILIISLSSCLTSCNPAPPYMSPVEQKYEPRKLEEALVKVNYLNAKSDTLKLIIFENSQGSIYLKEDGNLTYECATSGLGYPVIAACFVTNFIILKVSPYEHTNN